MLPFLQNSIYESECPHYHTVQEKKSLEYTNWLKGSICIKNQIRFDYFLISQNIAKIFNVLESFQFERNEEKRYKQSEADWMLVAMVVDR